MTYTLKRYDLEGQLINEETWDENLFHYEANPQLIKDYIVALRQNKRQWSANTKGRKEVVATGAKPHPQKGTGRARQGCLAAPHFRGGGRVFGPKPKFDQRIRINQKERQLAIRALLQERIIAGQVCLLSLKNKEKVTKTKQIVQFLKKMNFLGQRVFVLGCKSEKNAEQLEEFSRSIRNIPKAEMVLMQNINGYQMALSQQIIFLDPAGEEIQKMFPKGSESV